MSDEIYQLWLSTLYGLGSRKINHLLEQFDSAHAIFDAPPALLQTVSRLTDHNIQMITQNRDMRMVESLLRDMERKHIAFVSRANDAYPDLLREISDPPAGLFLIGEWPGDDIPKVSIIGSRRCSEYGLTAAGLLSKPLSKRGVVIVSGMARGIDSMAHRYALEDGGKTVAVLGCGVDICYPPENRALWEDIIRNGCVLSEYPPGVTPMPAYFPARNRIISGLSEVTVVVEAAAKSGTLITVDQALDQGRTVMAVPGNICSKLSEGTNRLIKDGAAPATCYEDILEVLGLPESITPAEQAKITSAALAPDEKLVYDSLNFEPVTFDELVMKTNSQAHAIHYICTILELKGYIRKLPGLRYIRNMQ